MKEHPILFQTIIDYPNYTISEYGVISSRNGILCQPLNSAKYHTVCLSKKNKPKRYYVHRLVGQAFVPNPENKPYINHKDGNKKNNHFSNLEWCTASENVIHAMQIGLKKNYGRGIALKPEHRKNLSLALKGKPSPCGMRGKKWSEKTRQQFIQSNTGISRNKGKIAYEYPVIQISLNGNIIKEWKSGAEAAKILGFSASLISAVCRGKRNKHKNFIWKFKTKNQK